MKAIEGINPRTGEYFYREPRKPKPRPPEFTLDFENSRSQLEGIVSPERMESIIKMISARNSLRDLGCLPDNHLRKLNRQITLKAVQAIAKHRKTFEV